MDSREALDTKRFMAQGAIARLRQLQERALAQKLKEAGREARAAIEGASTPDPAFQVGLRESLLSSLQDSPTIAGDSTGLNQGTSLLADHR